jgi:hypothetical protein
MSRRSESTFTEFQQNVTAISDYGLKFKFNHKFPKKDSFSQNLMPSLKQLWDIFPMICRYIPYYWQTSRNGLPSLMDYFDTKNSLGIYGVPMGGIGSGKN